MNLLIPWFWDFLQQNSLVNGTSLTYGGPHGQGDRVPSVLDQVDDVLMMHVGDIHPIDGQDPVPHMETPTPLSRTVLYDFTCKTVLHI